MISEEEQMKMELQRMQRRADEITDEVRLIKKEVSIKPY